MTLLLIFLGLSFGTPTPALAQQLQPVVFSTTTAEDIITAYAIKYGTPAAPLVATLKCESIRFTSTKQSKIPHEGGPNGYEDSWGVAQIHLPAHPDITKEQALDPLFSIDYAAKEFAAGRARQWTCYRVLFM